MWHFKQAQMEPTTDELLRAASPDETDNRNRSPMGPWSGRELRVRDKRFRVVIRESMDEEVIRNTINAMKMRSGPEQNLRNNPEDLAGAGF